MTRRAAARLQDILESVERIRLYENDVRVGAPVLLGRDAIVFRLVVIGGAAKDLPRDLTASEPGVDWSGIAGMRDVLTHQYHRIDQGIVDDVVARRLSDLEAACRRLLAGL